MCKERCLPRSQMNIPEYFSETLFCDHLGTTNWSGIILCPIEHIVKDITVDNYVITMSLKISAEKPRKHGAFSVAPELPFSRFQLSFPYLFLRLYSVRHLIMRRAP